MVAFSQAYAGKRVLITGGLGFIGSNLARRLVRLGAKVMLVNSTISQSGGSLFNIAGIENQVKVNITDVRDQHGMDYLIQGQDYLFNLAAKTSHVDSMEEPHNDMDINCRAQLSMLEACRRHNPGIKVIFPNTPRIYGKPQYLPVDEQHPLQPADVSSINKMAGEWYHILYNNVYHIRTCVLRMTNTYGPRMRVKDARQMFLGIWFRLLIEGKPIQVFGDGTQVRDFNYVDDVVDAFLLAGASDEADGQVFNLGADDPISLRDLAALLVEVNGGGEYHIVPFPPERKAIEIGDYYADYSKIRSILGWAPKVPLEDGLARTLTYYREHSDKYWEAGG